MCLFIWKHGLATALICLPCTVTNIRTKALNESTLNPAELPWALRVGPMIQSIKEQKGDVISFQEPRAEQVKDLKDGLRDGFDCTSITVWKDGDELATCWNTKPEVEFSKGWDGTYARAALISNLRLKSTQELFWVVNTHLDAAGAKAREEGAKLILSRIRPIIRGEAASTAPPQSLIFLNGDLNAIQDTPCYTILTGSRYSATSSPAAEQSDTFIDERRDFGSDKTTPTSESFGSGKDAKTIDYIMIADNGALERAANKWAVDDIEIVSNKMSYKDKDYIYSDHRMLVSRMSCSTCSP
ncbi:hypothetical protein P389DRAFT_202634 [Cystobasidium minutum MCA 4210]|uniref:uncharacterized protein n=1 Tax=Cystobasidium minutum MCA 4210 TaxID=1397322 RepID=UPI0034D0160E|eukprot:jgi/Rhomi1/202634/MIX3463_1_17